MTPQGRASGLPAALLLLWVPGEGLGAGWREEGGGAGLQRCALSTPSPAP